jgi:DNA-binding transcriptional LysR family regulator
MHDMSDSDINRRRPPASLRGVDLNLLHLFDRIYHTRNLTAAGAELGLTQSAVSRGLARLRHVYDDTLFVRQQRGVQPTPLAEHLAEPLAAALAIVVGTVDKPRFDPASAERVFRLGVSDIGERYFLPRLSRQLSRVAPGVVVEASSPNRQELLPSLASGDLDLLVGFLPELGKQVHLARLFAERFVYVARRGHPLVKGSLDIEQVRRLPHAVASPPGTRHAAAVERVLTGPRIRARVVLRVRSFLSLVPIVAETDLVAAVPSNLARLVATHLKLQLIAPPMKVPGFDVTMAWHTRFHHDPAVMWLRKVFIELFHQP